MTAAPSGGERLPLIDALKAIASQLIVLHHLAFYGPMSDHGVSLFPALLAWLSQDARIAVQAFLVMGGFLAARALAREGVLIEKPLSALLWHRVIKIVLPYLCALLLALAAAALARHLMAHPSIPEPPTLAQFLAHLFLLNGLLGYDSLSAGLWYVAIDFQLYLLLLALLALARHFGKHARTVGQLLVFVLTAAALFHFNRDSSWDNAAVYFFGAYGLGLFAFWAVKPGQGSPWLVVIFLTAAAALFLDFRSRIAVALGVATLIGLLRYSGTLGRFPESRSLAWLGKISYAVFLVHFPVCLVVNAVFERFAAHTPVIQLMGMVIAWAASLGMGALFHWQVEGRIARLFRK